jgi:hypothetical protein
VTNPNEPNFFSDTATPADIATSPARADASTQPPAAKPSLRSRFKPVYGFVALCAVALVWVAWPRGSSSGHGDATASSADPAATRYSDDLEANPPAGGPSPKAVAAVAAAAQASPVAGAPSAAAAASPAISNGEVDALHAQVASLSAALDTERASHSTCAAIGSRSTTSAAPPPVRHAVRASQHHGAREVLVDYHLNTIFNGQAWIERANQTFVVEKGGTVGGARVERIDAAAHVVETSLGEIR